MNQQNNFNTGVYCIGHGGFEKCYIGSSCIDIYKRWSTHRSQLRGNYHPNIHLQRAWNKYGESSFIFEVLEKCESEKCIEREQHYLNTVLFASCDDQRFYQLGYNICRVAGSPMAGRRHTSETKIKMSEAACGKKFSKIHKIRIGLAHKGMTRSNQARVNMSINHADVSGEKNPRSKLTRQDVDEIKQLVNTMTLREISEQYRVGITTIHDIKTGRRWN